MADEELKKNIGYAAADAMVKSGMKLGLGTGSTAKWAIRRIGQLLKEGKLTDIIAVVTSSQSEIECQNAGIPMVTLNDPKIDGHLDLTIDGADEIDPDYNLVKGGGGALLQEKIAGYASDHYAVLAAGDKLVSGIGPGFKVPVEVVREARVTASKAFEALGAVPEVRMAVKKMGPVITDNGNILIDLHFDKPINPPEMEIKINMIPGVVETGLFTKLKKLDAFIGCEDGTVKHIKVR
ncbi:MAG: ribose-5-phosphate isomerase RpiA [Spirochaetia bacterium]|nr:ribose-5-phosphate isomerase RpiA [Spirochaetia bacterium]